MIPRPVHPLLSTQPFGKLHLLRYISSKKINTCFFNYRGFKIRDVKRLKAKDRALWKMSTHIVQRNDLIKDCISDNDIRLEKIKSEHQLQTSFTEYCV